MTLGPTAQRAGLAATRLALLAVAAALMLSGCQDGMPDGHGGSELSAADRAECKLAGGEVAIAGMFANEICVMPYADGGKVCRKSSECLGLCLVESETSKTGTCSLNDNRFGCSTFLLEDGTVNTECQD
jgi:hypothetical protein